MFVDNNHIEPFQSVVVIARNSPFLKWIFRFATFCSIVLTNVRYLEIIFTAHSAYSLRQFLTVVTFYD